MLFLKNAPRTFRGSNTSPLTPSLSPGGEGEYAPLLFGAQAGHIPPRREREFVQFDYLEGEYIKTTQGECQIYF